MKKQYFTFSALMMSMCTALASCASSVPYEVASKSPLERIPMNVAEQVEILEIFLDPNASQITLYDRRLIHDFFRTYKDRGHGPVQMVLPEGTENQQYAVSAVAEARAIAYNAGVSYEMISGGARYDGRPSIVMSFVTYRAIKPDCPDFTQIDASYTGSNEAMPNLGCALRTNIAAMIADPADLLGQRPLDPTDTLRRQSVIENYRAGEPTAASRNEGESGIITE